MHLEGLLDYKDLLDLETKLAALKLLLPQTTGADPAAGASKLNEGSAMPDEKSQPDKFKEAARELECDDDDQRFKDRLRKLVEKSK